MAESGYRQEMPPPGGYKPLNWKRIPLRPFINGKLAFLGFIALTTYGFIDYCFALRKKRRHDVEEFDSNVAMEPLMAAERDREYLKQLRRNREAERELMKDVPGWRVGTYFGEPLFKTCTENVHVQSSWDEYFAHASTMDKDTSRLFFYKVL